MLKDDNFFIRDNFFYFLQTILTRERQDDKILKKIRKKIFKNYRLIYFSSELQIVCGGQILFLI